MASDPVRGVLDRNATGLWRGPKLLCSYFLLLHAPKVDELGDPSLMVDVVEYLLGDTGIQTLSLTSTFANLPEKQDREALSASRK